jgi:ribonuclease HII
MNLCGIDEAGRGPYAGPLVVAGVILNKDIVGLADSKKLSEKKRETLYLEILSNSQNKIVFVHHDEIDEIGLSLAIQKALKIIMKSLDANEYLFDGNTTYKIPNLNCMIKADTKIPEVSAGSILAKVSRDRYMKEIAHKYPQYGFEKHKGYGTKAHREAIAQYGLCEIHRKSFNII